MVSGCQFNFLIMLARDHPCVNLTPKMAAEEVKPTPGPAEGGDAAPPAPSLTKVMAKDTSSGVQDKAKLLEESKQRSLDVIAGTQSLLIVVILGLACIVAFSSRLFAVIRFESIIHEFDPW